MTLRVTHRSMQAGVLANLQDNLTRMGKLQEQLSSGRLISRPSDNPAGTVTALQLRGDIRATEQYQRNADSGIGWLGAADSALTQSLSVLRKARELVLQGSSTGAMGPDARTALATEVRGLRDSLLGVANTTYDGRPVFGGTTSGQRAFDPATGAYVGDGGSVQRRIGANTTVRVDVDGAAVFGNGTTSVFTLLGQIADHLEADPTQLAGDLTALDAATSTVLTSVTDVGTRYARLESVQQTAADQLIELKSSLATVESIDLPSTVVELQMQQVAYQAALGATARVIQPTLMDFLR